MTSIVNVVSYTSTDDIHGCKNYSIGDGKPGHVQARSILGPVYDHIKGPKRKKLLRSPERQF